MCVGLVRGRVSLARCAAHVCFVKIQFSLRWPHFNLFFPVLIHSTMMRMATRYDSVWSRGESSVVGCIVERICDM